MKVHCSLVASVMAASSMALTSAGDRHIVVPSYSNKSSSSGKEAAPVTMRSSEKEKYAPRFDGLRFIETLVTAHR